jgi:dTDP-L-rhamnose 4-epimerase
MKDILITGGAGFIGSALALKLTQEGHNVTILDNLSPQIHGENPDVTSATFKKIAHLPFIKADIRDREAIRKAVAKSEMVVHLAAETGTGQSMYQVSNYCDVNIQGTAVLIEAVLENKNRIERVVVASSRAIYGEGLYQCSQHGTVLPQTRSIHRLNEKIFEHFCPQCDSQLKLVATTEGTAPRPQSVYGITKLAQEELILNLSQSIGKPTVALRFQNVYGPGQSLSNPYTGILSIFSTRARTNKPITIFEDGIESRDFVFIDDVVQSLNLTLITQLEGAHAFNIGSGESTSVNDVVKEITTFFKSDSKITITGEYRIGDIRHNYADLKRAKEVLKYNPTVFFKDGIKKFLSWAAEQANISDSYEKSLQELRSKGLLK